MSKSEAIAVPNELKLVHKLRKVSSVTHSDFRPCSPLETIILVCTFRLLLHFELDCFSQKDSDSASTIFVRLVHSGLPSSKRVVLQAV